MLYEVITRELPLSNASLDAAAFDSSRKKSMADGESGSWYSTVPPIDPERKITHRGTPRNRARSRAVSVSTASMSKSPRSDVAMRVRSVRRRDSYNFV